MRPLSPEDCTGIWNLLHYPSVSIVHPLIQTEPVHRPMYKQAPDSKAIALSLWRLAEGYTTLRPLPGLHFHDSIL